MARTTRWAPLALSLALLIGLGSVGLWLVRASNASAEVALGAGAARKQLTVARLADQFLQIAAKEAFDVASAAPLELTPDSAADAAVLAELIGRPRGFFDHGAVLTDTTGRRLTVVGDLPPADDAGYAPLRAALLRGDPGVSSVMEVAGHPVVAVGVPVLRDGRPAGVLVAFFRADTSRLQRYSEQLGRGTDAVGMVIDGSGTVVAARHVDLVGSRLPRSPARPGDTQGGHTPFERDGVELVATWAPIETGGWMLVEEEPAAGFYASVRGQSDTARLALVALLLAAGISATILNHRTDLARRRGEQRSDALVRDANDVITVLDRDGVVTYASPAMQPVLGHDPAAVVGTRAAELFHPDDLVALGAALTAAATAGDVRQRIQARVARADGSWCPCEVVVSDQHADPSVRGTVVSIRDIAELVALHDRLSHRALHDPLTELPNRTQLEHRMGQALAACDDERGVAALFLDLDGFKAVNDRLGHDRGDELLVHVADRLRRCIRDGDTVARIGGDEFVIVLAGTQAESNAVRVAARALELLAEPFRVGGEDVHVGASIGIAIGDADSEPESILREADAAMYLAKERGRFRYEFPSEGVAGAGVRAPVVAPATSLRVVSDQIEDHPPSTTRV